MTAETARPMYILSAQKRAVIKPKTGSETTDWPKDEEGFLRRWPDNKRPDLGIQRSESADRLIAHANRLNEAQLRSGFLDWLYVVDIDTPVHACAETCPTWNEEAA